MGRPCKRVTTNILETLIFVSNFIVKYDMHFISISFTKVEGPSTEEKKTLNNKKKIYIK